ncbi:hypothetical protein B0H13DRAFT_1918026 [Mycena leptocephala]|nr:hypothetical protein B0H13DRAFT_1918026 [Mycena leptocephala]
MNPNDVPTFPTRHFFDGHVRKDNTIFGVHCGDPTFILNLPARKDAPIHHPGQKCAEFQRTTWIYPATPYLLFVPRNSAFHGPLFARLRVPWTGLPIFQDEDNGRWMLSPTLADQWAQLENGLRRVLAAIHQLHPGGINEGFIPLRVPSHYGYAGTRPTHASALYFAMEARNAFLPLMGNLTMMMVASDYHGVPNWHQKVIDISQVHSQWFADLEASAVGDLHIPRVGGILDFTCDYEDARLQRRHPLEWILNMVVRQVSMPLYFHWGDITHQPDFPIPVILREDCFFPDAAEIYYLLDLPGKVTFSPWRLVSNEKMESERLISPYKAPAVPAAVTPLPAHMANLPLADAVESPAHAGETPAHAGKTMPRFPQPEGNSGQRYGENFDAFFAPTRHEITSLLRKSPVKERKSACNGKHTQLPELHRGSKEPEFSFGRKRKMADMWDEFTPAQRLYDGYHNEWDLCTAFAPDEEPENDGGDGPDDDDDDYGDVEGSGVADNGLPELIDFGDRLILERSPPTTADLLHSHGLEPGEIYDDALPVEQASCDTFEIPFARFGFTMPIAPSTYHKGPQRLICLKSLGNDKWAGLDHDRYRHLLSLLGYLEVAQSIEEIPSDLLDLRQDVAEISDESNWAVGVSQETLNHHKVYVVRPKDPLSERYPVHILLPSAATAVMVSRMGWGPDEIIHRLLEHGVEFRICLKAGVYHVPPPPPRASYTGLGYCRPKYKPTPVDHGVYMMLCNRFLASPRGRAALFIGGIVARLARLVVDQELASLGPTSEVLRTGIRLWDGQSSAAYWDDVLTEQEIDLICGVYEIATGRVNKITEEH